jgi:hypothetical protein
VRFSIFFLLCAVRTRQTATAPTCNHRHVTSRTPPLDLFRALRVFCKTLAFESVVVGAHIVNIVHTSYIVVAVVVTAVRALVATREHQLTTNVTPAIGTHRFEIFRFSYVLSTAWMATAHDRKGIEDCVLLLKHIFHLAPQSSSSRRLRMHKCLQITNQEHPKSCSGQ